MLEALADLGGFMGLLFGITVCTVIEFLFMGSLSMFHYSTNMDLLPDCPVKEGAPSYSENRIFADMGARLFSRAK